MDWEQPVRALNRFTQRRHKSSALTDALFYDVYTQLSELHLSNLGMAVEWYDVDLGESNNDEGIWGETRKYFTIRYYRLPVASLKQKVA